MPSLTEIFDSLIHPIEFWSIFQWKVLRVPLHSLDLSKQTETLRECFYFLNKTSRSFSSAIRELHPELMTPICLFYLILRGLDTIEDDMTIPFENKECLLQDFVNVLEKPGWFFDGNDLLEKDRDLLIRFGCVITEFAKIKDVYKKIIKDITKRMGNGMVDCAKNMQFSNGINTKGDYERYCHYVAGLVGEGLTRMFVESDLAHPELLYRTGLYESMGQFLQQANIIRDIKEDFDANRRFWPKEIWLKHVKQFDHLFLPKNNAVALNCVSEMILYALDRIDDCLLYLTVLNDQSVFNFCAVPMSMAIATLDLCFRNPDVFKKTLKISNGQACYVLLRSTGKLSTVCDIFLRYTDSIKKKSDPNDPNFKKIVTACDRIQQSIEKVRKVPRLSYKVNENSTSTRYNERWNTIYMTIAALLALYIVIAFIFF